MALEDYNSLLVEHLQELVAAADLADAETTAEFIEKLRVEGFDDDDLAAAVELYEGGEYDRLQQWAGEQIMRLSPDEDPFAAGAFDDFDIDDAFLDLEDTGFREPSEGVDPGELLEQLDDSNVEVLEELSLSAEAEDDDGDAESDPSVQTPNRPHVLSGKFNLVDKSKIADDKAERSLSESLDAVAAEADDAEVDPDRQTRPNVTPDLGGARGGATPKDEQPFESGVSQARYQAEEPAPALHRLPAASDISGEVATTPPEVGEADSPLGGAFRSTSEASLASAASEEGEKPESESEAEPPSDEFSIEILDEPSEAESAAESDDEPVELKSGGGFDFGFDDDDLMPAAEPEDDVVADADDLGFDLGLVNPEDSEPPPAGAGDPGTTRPGPNDASSTKPGPDVDTAERDRELTPLRQLPAQDPEDMFFELAEALAAESSAGEQYRGEPIRAHSAKTNPFGNDAPTGTQHDPLPAQSASSAAESHVQTNMNAILLEAHRLRSAGELEAALDITKKVLSRGPNSDAEYLKNEIETQLESGHLERIGDLSGTPTLAIELGAMAELDLDHRAGYIISQVDGMMTFEDLIELSGMSRLETLDVFVDLMDQGVIEVS